MEEEQTAEAEEEEEEEQEEEENTEVSRSFESRAGRRRLSAHVSSCCIRCRAVAAQPRAKRERKQVQRIVVAPTPEKKEFELPKVRIARRHSPICNASGVTCHDLCALFHRALAQRSETSTMVRRPQLLLQPPARYS